MHRTGSISTQGIETWVSEFLWQARVGHLATSTTNGRPYVVPICFAFDGRIVYSSIDEKPKRSQPRNLRRVLNIVANPKVSLVIDSYSEDWRKLRYVIVHGLAELLDHGHDHGRAVSLLRRKYRQYLSMKLEERPIIKIKPTKFVTWRASGRAR